MSCTLKITVGKFESLFNGIGLFNESGRYLSIACVRFEGGKAGTNIESVVENQLKSIFPKYDEVVDKINGVITDGDRKW